jgi:hypothetical protein
LKVFKHWFQNGYLDWSAQGEPRFIVRREDCVFAFIYDTQTCQYAVYYPYLSENARHVRFDSPKEAVEAIQLVCSLHALKNMDL